MITARDILMFFIVLAAALVGPAFLRAEDAAPPVPLQPEQVQLSMPAAAPMDMRAEDADRLIQQMKAMPAGIVPGSPKAGSGTAAQPAGGVSRTIKVPVPEVVNRSTSFQFQDATERSKPEPAVRSMSERRAAVEAFRQSLAREQK